MNRPWRKHPVGGHHHREPREVDPGPPQVTLVKPSFGIEG